MNDLTKYVYRLNNINLLRMAYRISVDGFVEKARLSVLLIKRYYIGK